MRSAASVFANPGRWTAPFTTPYSRLLEHRSLVPEKPVVGCFLRVGNDDIQALEKSTSNPLIRNDRICGASGLRVFDAGRRREKKGLERAEWGFERATGLGSEVRRLPQKPPATRGTTQRKKANREGWQSVATELHLPFIFLSIVFSRLSLTIALTKLKCLHTLRQIVVKGQPIRSLAAVISVETFASLSAVFDLIAHTLFDVFCSFRG